MTIAYLALPRNGRTGTRDAASRLRRHSASVASHLLMICGKTVRAVAAVGAAAYLVAHTVRESSYFLRLAELYGAGARADPGEPLPDPSLDLVDLASWESFPASDPPGYR